MDDPLQDRVVLLLTNGMTVEQAEGYCLQQGRAPDEARSLVAEARKRLTRAADYARDEQLGLAVARLQDLYAKSMSVKPPDTRTALQAQRELNRLLDLYSGGAAPGEGGPGDGEAARALELIASYLLPLRLTDERYPTEEHARVAAEILRSHGLSRVRQAQAAGTGA